MLLCIVYQGAAEFRILFYAIHEAEVKRLHEVYGSPACFCNQKIDDRLQQEKLACIMIKTDIFWRILTGEFFA